MLWNTVNNFGAVSFENRFADVGGLLLLLFEESYSITI